jgi:hypothetical protein
LHICWCVVYFNLEAKNEHDSTGKLVHWRGRGALESSGLELFTKEKLQWRKFNTRSMKLHVK